MGKFLTYVVVVIVILLGVPNIYTCISFLFDRTSNLGVSQQLEKEIDENDKPGYSLIYDLDGGILIEKNPEYYGLFTETFTLNNPVKDGYEFLGWTGSNGDIPQLNVTICKGSVGDLSFEAVFALELETPTLSILDNQLTWNAIDNANGYTININGVDYSNTSELTYNLLDFKNYFIAGNNIIKLKAFAQTESTKIYYSDYSEPIIFNIKQLDKPIITINGFNISWDKIVNANKYVVVVGANEITTLESEINLLNYVSFISQSGQTAIRVRALSNQNDAILDSQFSDIKYFDSPQLKHVELELIDKYLHWTYDENVEFYELYLNGQLVKKILGLNSIDPLLFATDMREGSQNVFLLKAYANGYISSTSNTIVYSYVNLAKLENKVLTADFSRTSDSYTLDSGDYLSYINSNSITISHNGSFISFDSYYQSEPYEKDYPYNEKGGTDACWRVLNYLVDFNRNLYVLDFVDATVPDERLIKMHNIMTLINDNYINGKGISTIDLSGLLRFKIKESGEYYTPNKISITVKYVDMLIVSTFKENCSNFLSDFSSNHIVDINYNFEPGTTQIKRHTIFVNLETADGQKIEISYSNDGYSYQIIGGEKLTVSDIQLEDLCKQNKFKLSSGYYFTIDILALLNLIVVDSHPKIYQYVSSSTWSGNSVEQLNLSGIIDVYFEDERMVEFNYELKLKYTLFSIYY